MSKQFKRIFALLLVLAMVLSVLPTAFASGVGISGRADAEHVYTEEENAILDNDVFAKIEAVKANAAWFAKAYQNYQEYSRKARTWTVITLCVGIAVWLLYLSFYAVILAKLGDLSELGNF